MMGDDGEKFGAWPTTWEHCWGEGRWVERFFEALEANADWLTTTTPSAWLAEPPPIGRVYVPTGSYAEMGEWALPADESRVFAARAARGAEADGAARGALAARRVLAQLPGQVPRDQRPAQADAADVGQGRRRWRPAPVRDRALDHLYRGQSNDCYWHGLFGGIYISHMRLATYEHLIAAEDLADTDAGRLHAAERRDLDMDGQDDVRLAGPGPGRHGRPDVGAGIGGWDIRAVRHALAPVLRRRPEAYHQTLREHDAGRGDPDAPPARTDCADLDPRDGDDEGGRARRAALLRPIRAPLGPGPVPPPDDDARGLGDGAAPSSSATPSTAPSRSTSSNPTGCRDVARRAVATRGRGRVPVLRHQGALLGRRPALADPRADRHPRRTGPTGPLAAILGIEWTLTMLGGGGNPAAWWEIGGARSGHDTRGAAAGVTDFAQGNDYVGIAVGTTVSAPADAWWAPVETDLELGGRVRARLPGRRAAPVVAARRWRPAGAFSVTVSQTVVTTARDRSPRRTGRPLASAVAPPHEPRPARRPRPLLPAVADRPVQRHGPRGSVGRAGPRLDGPRQRRLLPAQRRARQPAATSRGTSGRRWPAGWRTATRSRTAGSWQATGASTAWPSRSTTRSCRSPRPPIGETEIRWGLRDFELRFGRPSVGMWLPETAVDLATLRLLADAGRPAHDPRARGRSDGAARRDPPAVPRRAGRRPQHRGRAVRRGPVDGDLLRARRDRRRRPVHARARRARGCVGPTARTTNRRSS